MHDEGGGGRVSVLPILILQLSPYFQLTERREEEKVLCPPCMWSGEERPGLVCCQAQQSCQAIAVSTQSVLSVPASWPPHYSRETLPG